MFKYDFIYLFLNSLRLIFLKGPSGGKKAHGGGEPSREFCGGGLARLGGPNGAHLGPAHQPWPNQACGIVPHCLAGKVGSRREPI